MKIKLWQLSYLLGFLLVAPIILFEFLGFHAIPETVAPYIELLGGIMLIAGA